MADTADTADTGNCSYVAGSGCSGFVSNPAPACPDRDDTGKEATDSARVQGRDCGCETPPQLSSGGGGALAWALLFALARRFVLLFVLTGAARGQGVDGQQLDVGDGGTFVSLREGDIGEKNSVGAALSYTWARKPVVLVVDDGTTTLLRQVLTRNIGLAVNFGGWVRLGVSVPRHTGIRFLGLQTSRHIGDVGLALGLPLRQSSKAGGFDLSWTVHTDFATGLDEAYLGDPTGGISGIIAGEGTLGGLYGGFNLGLRLQQQTDLPGIVWGSRVPFAFALRRDVYQTVAVGIETFGSLPGSPPPYLPGETPLEVLGVGSVSLYRGLSLTLGGGSGLTNGLGSPAARFVAMLDLHPREYGDRDDDGIVDPRDRCPDDPEDIDLFRDADGCPDPDNDGDGLIDREDPCPNRAEVINGYMDDDGCPDVASRVTVTVRTADPELAELAVVRVADQEWQAFSGEPIAVVLPPGTLELEADAVGHRGYSEPLEIPRTGEPLAVEIPLEVLTFGTLSVRLSAPDGQPLAGVIEGEERASVSDQGLTRQWPAGPQELLARSAGYAPLLTEIDLPPGGELDLELTLQPAQVMAEIRRIEATQQVGFELDSAELFPESLEVLDELAVMLLDNPEIELLRIEGHADGLGTSRYNYELSLRRAEAVRAYLVGEGVAEDRLVTAGSGEAWARRQPEESRKVDFVVIIWNDEPSAAEPSPP